MCAFGVFELKWFTTYLSDIALKTEYWCLAYKSIVQSLHVGVKLAIILQKNQENFVGEKNVHEGFFL